MATLGKYRIAVLMGGKSIEREVSFNSGRTICDHLDSNLYEVIPLFQDADGLLYVLPWHFLHRGKIADFQSRLATEATLVSWDQLKELIDFVYIAVHGRYAEDGTLQGMLEVLGIPYLGAKVFGSALGMNKVAQKNVLASSNIEVPRGFCINAHQIEALGLDMLEALMSESRLQFPLIVKPSHEGSSLGVAVVRSLSALYEKIYAAATVNPGKVQDVLVEEKIEGMEFVCVSLEKVNPLNTQERLWFSLPLTEVVHEVGTDFFDYEQKYMPGRAAKITPARCSDHEREAIKVVCEQVAKLLQFETISRIDGILADDGRIVIIDPNSLTGMGPATFLFHQAAEAGYSHAQLINLLIENELLKYGMVGARSKISREATDGGHAMNKKRVAVLLGGDSNEREISLESGRNTCYKLSPMRYEVMPVFVNDAMQLFKLNQRLLLKNSTREIAQALTPSDQITWADLPKLVDFVFIALHGGRGENGSVQGTLEMLGLPYNGPDVLTSALCMDKYATTQFLKNRGFDVPAAVLVERANWISMDIGEQKKYLHKNIIEKLGGYPVIVKPHNDGCSVMVTRATSDEECIVALQGIFANNKNVAMVEEFVRGMELTVGVVGNAHPMALPPSQAVAQKGILSIEEKFLPGAGENQTPAPLPDEALIFVRKKVEEAFVAVGGRGYSRIDCFYQAPEISPLGAERVVFLEINTLPALTPATCLFHQAAELGIKPMELFDKIIELGLEAREGIEITPPVLAAQADTNDVQASLF